MEDIIEIVKSLEDCGLLLKRVTETVQNEVKEQKWGFLSMLISMLIGILISMLISILFSMLVFQKKFEMSHIRNQIKCG